ncbi:MAG: exodeoxyribonuclease VII small subunit [Chitinophagaceae bacterium]
MTTNLSYTDALAALESIVEQIEDDSIQLDSLAEKVKQANELIQYCEAKLRNIEISVKDAGGAGL